MTLRPHAPRSKECAQCLAPFIPARPMQQVCSPRCAARLAKVKRAAEKQRDKERKEKLKTLSKLEGECRLIVQAIARIRDRNDGCISCHLPATWDGQWHGSHFRPAGNHSAVELHLWNIHKSCSACNHYKSGNIAEYTPRLIAKIGQDKVDWLMAQNHTVKRTREYLYRFKTVMGKRLRRMEKRR